jgi:magnesium-transporting ATPase (P-type)
LGILGFKEELKPDALGFVRSLTAANIYTWVLSGDSEACVISCS